MTQLLTLTSSQKFPPQVNRALYKTVNEVDSSLQLAYKKEPILPTHLRQLADDCSTLLGLECSLRGVEGLGEVMSYLHNKHPTIETVNMSFESISPLELKQISRGCPILTGLKCEMALSEADLSCTDYYDPDFDSEELDSDELIEAVGILARKHPELQLLEIASDINAKRPIKFADKGLSALFRLQHLKVLHLQHTKVSGENISMDTRDRALP